MKIRLTIRKLSFAVALTIMVAASAVFFPSQTTHAATAQNSLAAALPAGFNETILGETYTWKEASPWYTNNALKRVDTGKWVVKEGNYSQGTVDVGVNEFTSGNGHPAWAIDITTSIHGVNLPHEIIESSYPNDGRFQHESAWGFANSYYGPSNAVSYITNPSDGPFPVQEDEATGGAASPMFHNMQHQIARQDESYSRLENVYKVGAGATPGAGQRVASSTTPHVLPIPAAVLVLAAVGLVLAVGGGTVAAVCNANFCGKHSKTWAVLGGIAAVLGTLCTIISGASVTGWIIAGRAAAAAATEGVQAVAEAERAVELGSTYASSPAASGIASDIMAAFAEPEIGGLAP